MFKENIIEFMEQEKEKYELEVNLGRIDTGSGQLIGNTEIREFDLIYADKNSDSYMTMTYKDNNLDAPSKIACDGTEIALYEDKSLENLTLEAKETPFAPLVENTINNPAFVQIVEQQKIQQQIHEEIISKSREIEQEQTEQLTQEEIRQDENRNEQYSGHQILYTPDAPIQFSEKDTGTTTSPSAETSKEVDFDERAM